jgi:hypothetical protein
MKNCNETIERIFNDGYLTNEEKAWKIIEVIYNSPKFFHTNCLDEDNRSEFVISLLPVLSRLDKIYTFQRQSLAVYIQCIVMRQMMHWKKNLARDNAKDAAISSYLADKCENQDIYNEIADIEAKYSPDESDVNLLKKIVAKNLNLHRNETMRNGIICLCLKSAFCITDDCIRKISKLIDVNEDKIFGYIMQVKELTLPKVLSCKEKAERLNVAYFKRKKSIIEMEKVDKNSNRYSEIEKSFSVQNKRWRQKLTERVRYLPTPSYQIIAQVLGMSKRKIELVLAKAKKQAKKLLEEK